MKHPYFTINQQNCMIEKKTSNGQQKISYLKSKKYLKLSFSIFHIIIYTVTMRYPARVFFFIKWFFSFEFFNILFQIILSAYPLWVVLLTSTGLGLFRVKISTGLNKKWFTPQTVTTIFSTRLNLDLQMIHT
jgi:hypothetical protein